MLTVNHGRGCKPVPYHNLLRLASGNSTSFATFEGAYARLRATIQAMGSARKPVIVRKFSREWYAGYAGAVFGQDSPVLEVLDLTGKVLTVAWDTVKWVCYVRDFPSGSDQNNPERLLQKKFTVRPRATGLWLRMTLNDGDELEGIAPMTVPWSRAPVCC